MGLLDRFMDKWSLLERRFMPDYVWQAAPLTFWRERILFTMCFIAVFIGPLALIPSVWLAYLERLTHVVVLDLAAYGLVLFIFFGRRLSLKVRAWTAYLLLYTLGSALLFLLGHLGAGYIWLFGASVMMASILGFGAAIWSIVLNGLTFVAVAGFAVYGAPEWAQAVENILQKWIVMGVNFLLLNALVSLTTAFILDGLKKTLKKEQKVSGSLRKSEKQYRLLAENVSDIIWIMDLSTLAFSYVSPSVERKTGFTPAEASSLSLEETLTPKSLEFVTKLLEEELSKENLKDIDKDRTRTIEIEQIHKSGRYTWSEVTLSFIRDENGNPTAILGVTRDIDKRKNAEIEKAEKMEQLQQALREIKTLQGMLPICSVCKRIRDDAGYWQLIESYIQEHTMAKFSHGICPNCAKKVYPDLDVKKYDILKTKDEKS